MVKTSALAAALLLLFGGEAQANSTKAIDLAKRFGARPQVMSVSLSPDGLKFAVIAAEGTRSTRVTVGTVDGSQSKHVLTSGNDLHLSRCNWASNTKLVCTMYSTSGTGKDVLDYNRTVTMNADGTDLKFLSAPAADGAVSPMQMGGQVIDWLPDENQGDVLMTRQFVPVRSSHDIIATGPEGVGVERVNINTLQRSTVEPPRPGTDFFTDGHGAVRIEVVQPSDNSGHVTLQTRYLYRKIGSKVWEPLSAVTFTDGHYAGFRPYVIDRDLNAVYGFERQNGHDAIFKVALDGSLKKDLVFARSDTDIDGLIDVGRSHRAVGASFTSDQRRTDFFDPDMKKIAAALSKAMPDLPDISVASASGDESKLMLLARGPADPGQYLLFDRKTRHLSPLFSASPELDDVKLAPVRTISYPAADGTAILAHLTLPVGSSGKGLPAVVLSDWMYGDGTSFNWLAQFLAARGYAVLQPSFRKEAGDSDDWLSQRGFSDWKFGISAVDDAGRWLEQQGIAAPGKLAIMGWNKGGYAALQASVLDPELFKAIVAICPITDLETYRQEVSRLRRANTLRAMIGNGPHLREGSPAQNANRIKAPVLLFHGDLDLSVDVGESRLMAANLKAAGGTVELVEFKGLDTALDDADARATMLAKTDTFLRQILGLTAD